MCCWPFRLSEGPMRVLILLLLAVSMAFAAKTLDTYVIDVEGGKSVLIVTPAGESMLIDVGWPASAAREASTNRIVEAAKAAGLDHIDYLLISHYDVDHIGDVPKLAAAFPIRNVVDHGPIDALNKNAEQRYVNYAVVYDKIH